MQLSRSSQLPPGTHAVDVRLPAVILSLCVSAWIVYSKGIINVDGVIYISAARLIAAGDWVGSCQIPTLCWLLYPSLIAFIGKLTSLGLENSAYCLDAIFSALMVYVFLTLVRELGADRRTLLIAAFVILLHPYLNESRTDVIRDHGYWAFYLLTMLCFIRYWRYPGWGNAIAWGAAASVATLFRIEGIVFQLLLPFVLLVDSSRRVPERLLLLLKVHVFTGILLTGLLAWWAVDPAFSVEQTGRLLEPVQRLTEVWERLHTGLESRVQVIGEKVLGEYLDHYALSALWVTLGFIILSKIVNTLTPLYSLLLLFKRLLARFNPPAGLIRIIAWLVILNLCILMVELLTRFVLSGRFAVPLVLSILLVIPFVLNTLYGQWQVRHSHPVQRWLLFPAIVTGLLFMSVDGLYPSDKGSKTYLRDAGYWLRDEAFPEARIFSDNTRIIYYSGQRVTWAGRPAPGDILKQGVWRQYDYLAIHIAAKDQSLRHAVDEVLGTPVQAFHNRKRDSVLIYATAAAS